MVRKLCLMCILVLMALPALADEAERRERAEALVERAVAHVAEVGHKQAAADFNKPGGDFFEGELYILFYDFKGICLANGFLPYIVGLNRWDVEDADGKHQIREMVDVAQNGGGWVDYKFMSPDTGEVLPKSTYVKRAGDLDAFIGCGIYLDE